MTIPTTSVSTPDKQGRSRKRTVDAAKSTPKVNQSKAQSTPAAKTMPKTPVASEKTASSPTSEQKKRKRTHSRKPTANTEMTEKTVVNPQPVSATTTPATTPSKVETSATPKMGKNARRKSRMRTATEIKVLASPTGEITESTVVNLPPVSTPTTPATTPSKVETSATPKMGKNARRKSRMRTATETKALTSPVAAETTPTTPATTPSKVETSATPKMGKNARRKSQMRAAAEIEALASPAAEQKSVAAAVVSQESTGKTPPKTPKSVRKQERSRKRTAVESEAGATPVNAVQDSATVVSDSISKSAKKARRRSRKRTEVSGEAGSTPVAQSPASTPPAVATVNSASPNSAKKHRNRSRKSIAPDGEAVALAVETPVSAIQQNPGSPVLKPATPVKSVQTPDASVSNVETPASKKKNRRLSRKRNLTLNKGEKELDQTPTKQEVPEISTALTPPPTSVETSPVLQNASPVAKKSPKNPRSPVVPKVRSLETKEDGSVKPGNPLPAAPSAFVIKKDQIHEGVQALLKSLKFPGQNGQKPKLFEDAVKPVYLQIASVRVPKGEARFVKFVLPNKPITDESEVCLIVKDLKPGIKEDHEENVESFKSVLEASGVSHMVTEVISLRQLKVEYKPHEAKRKLSKRYDAFLVDERIYFRIPLFLGKFFYGTDKYPIPVKLEDPDSLKTCLEKSLKTSLLSMKGTGSTMQMVVGNTSMTSEEISANVSSIVESLNEKFPGKFANIRSLSIHTQGSLSVPLYISLLARDNIRAPVLESKITMGTIVGDVSTLPPGEAAVIEPDGTVRVIRNPHYKPTLLDDDDLFLPEPDMPDDPESDDEERPKKKVKKSGGKAKPSAKKVKKNVEESDEEGDDVGAVVDEKEGKGELDGSDSEVDLEEERYLSKMMAMKESEPEEKSESPKKETKKEKVKGGKVKKAQKSPKPMKK